MNRPGCTKDAGSRQQRSKPASYFRGQDMAAAVILGRSIYVLFDKRNYITHTKGRSTICFGVSLLLQRAPLLRNLP